MLVPYCAPHPGNRLESPGRQNKDPTPCAIQMDILEDFLSCAGAEATMPLGGAGDGRNKPATYSRVASHS